MDFLDGLRYIFNEAKDAGTLAEMQMQLAEKLKAVENYKHQIEVYDLLIMLFKMQAYKLSRILDEMKERAEHNAKLCEILKQILKRTLLMALNLDQIQIEKIRLYDEVPLDELSKQSQQQVEESQNLADQMNKRNIVVKFRSLQRNQQKILEIYKKFKGDISQKRQYLNMKMRRALDARNTAIVRLIRKTMKKPEPHMQTSILRKPTFVAISTNEAVEPFQHPSTAVILKKSMLQPKKLGAFTADLKSDAFKKFEFGALNIEKENESPAAIEFEPETLNTVRAAHSTAMFKTSSFFDKFAANRSFNSLYGPPKAVNAVNMEISKDENNAINDVRLKQRSNAINTVAAPFDAATPAMDSSFSNAYKTDDNAALYKTFPPIPSQDLDTSAKPTGEHVSRKSLWGIYGSDLDSGSSKKDQDQAMKPAENGRNYFSAFNFDIAADTACRSSNDNDEVLDFFSSNRPDCGDFL